MLLTPSFGNWLRLKRKALDMTREGLADRVGCSAATIRKLETEERRPSGQIAERLAEIFGIPREERNSFYRFARGDRVFPPGEPAGDAPWLQRTSSVHTNLPAALTSLAGREREITDLRGYLQNPGIRLITLVGPPGIGKTRLSLETAQRSLQDFRDGVFFVPLAPLEEAALVASTMIQTFGFIERGRPSSIEILEHGISDKQVLLVLDNCEHLIEEVAPLVTRLLSACSRLKVIATSRESLRVPGEWLYIVPTLEIPGENTPVDLQTAGRFAALTLFTERARAIHPEFGLNENNIRAVISICRQLDGLPLAIELIASRMRLMSAQALLDRMTGQFILTADGMRAAPARQKTLKNAIGWSYDFLAPEEQKLFAYLSVFSGGFTLEAAEEIFSSMFTGQTVTGLVTFLSDKSLLSRISTGHGEIRFNMLSTIRQFALEHLRQTGEEHQIRDAHLNYFVRSAEAAERKIRGPEQGEWIERIEEEHNNNRAALEWAIASQKSESALRLLCALGWPWEVRGHYNEAHSWLDRIRMLLDVQRYPFLYSQVLNHVGRYLWTQANYQVAHSMLEESRAISSRLGEEGEIRLAETLNWLGLLILFTDTNGSEKARPMFERGLELYQKCDNTWGSALSSFHLGILESELRNYDKALFLFEQGYERFQVLGDIFFMGRVSLFLGYLHFDLDNQVQARRFFEEHLQYDSQLKFWNGIAEALRDLGKWHRRYGEGETADDFENQCRVICREHGLAPLIP